MARPKPAIELPEEVKRKLRAVRRRAGLIEFARGMMLAAAALIAMMLVAIALDWQFVFFNHELRAALTVSILSLAAAIAFIAGLIPLARSRRLEQVAETVDRAVPKLEERWSTVTELSRSEDPPEIVGARPLIAQVAREAQDAHQQVIPSQIMPAGKLRWSALGLAAIFIVLAATAALAPLQTVTLLRRFWAPWANVSLTTVKALTGDRIIAKGEPLELKASVTGRHRPTATLLLRGPKAEESLELACPEKTGESITWKLNAVKDDFAYQFRCGDGETPWHVVKAVDRPDLANAEMRIVPPAYSKLPPADFKTLPAGYQALEGSRLELALLPNKPLTLMNLKLTDKTSRTLTQAHDRWYRFGAELHENLTLTPLMKDQYGLTNPAPPICNIEVYQDQAPQAQIVSPTDQIQARPDDKLTINFQASDDFGLSKAELVVKSSDQTGSKALEVIPIPLKDSPNIKNVAGQVELDLKKYNLKSGSELNYAIRVTDTREVSALSTREWDQQKRSPARDAEQRPNDGAAAQSESPADNRPGKDREQPQNEKQSQNPTPNQHALNQKSDSGDPGSQPKPAGSTQQNQPLDVKRSENTKPAQAENRQQQVQVADANNSRQQQTNTSQTRNESQDSATQDPSNAKAQQKGADNQNQQAQNGSEAAQPQNAGDQKPEPAQNESPSEKKNADGKKEEQQKNGPSQQQANKQTQTASAAKPGEPQDQQGNPPPPNSMRYRSLPLTTVSASHSIRVDDWNGSFEGQAREKLQIDIAKYLETIKRQLNEGRTGTEALSAGAHANQQWAGPQEQGLRTATDAVRQAEQTSTQLNTISEKTPYAFIGFQILDISRSHISPAVAVLIGAARLAQNPPDQLKKLDEADFHIVQALAQLEALNKQYEAVRAKEKAADALDHVAKMHQIFVEDMYALLKSIKPRLNPRDPKKMLEVSDEYVKKLKEQAEKLKKLEEELAKALAQDPDLMRRMMAAMRKQGTTIRDQLTLLARRQGALAENVRNWAERRATAAGELQQQLAGQHAAEQAELAEAAAALAQNFQTWAPHELSTSTLLLKTRDASQAIAVNGFEAARELQTGAPDAAAQRATQLLDQLDALDAQINELALAGGDSPQLFAFVGKRLDETRKLRAREASWGEKVKAAREGRFGHVGELDQYALMMDTSAYAEKLERVMDFLAGRSEQIAQKGRELTEQVKTDAVGKQMTAGKALSHENLMEARDREKQTVDSFARAEQLFNELLDLVDRDLAANAKPPAEPDDLPTLKDILAMLQKELEACEKLGNAPLPLNVAMNFDWLLPGEGAGAGSGSGSGSGTGSSGSGSSGNPMGRGQASEGRGNPRLQELQQQMREAQAALQQALKGMEQTNQSAQARLAQALGGKRPDKGAGSVAGVDPSPNAPAGRDWNVLVSKLQKDLQQGRGTVPPEQYRQAIDEYFRAIYTEAARQNAASGN